MSVKINSDHSHEHDQDHDSNRKTNQAETINDLNDKMKILI